MTIFRKTLAAFLILAFTVPPVCAAENTESAAESFLQSLASREMSLIDLSHQLEDGMPYFPGGEGFRLIPIYTHEKHGYASNRITSGEHIGTHIDAPIHFAEDGETIDKLDLSGFVGRLCVLDVRDKASDSDYEVTIEDFAGWEETHGPLPERAVLVIRTGWAERWRDPEKYVNMGKDGMPHFPGFSENLARYLVQERSFYGIGTDALSVDPGKNRQLTVHRIFHGAGKYHIENIANLDKVKPAGALLFAFPVLIKNASAAPARVVAVQEKAS